MPTSGEPGVGTTHLQHVAPVPEGGSTGIPVSWRYQR